jgi:hypothetical protein
MHCRSEAKPNRNERLHAFVFNTSMPAKLPPNDESSATRRTRAFDCNHDAPAGFAAAHG